MALEKKSVIDKIEILEDGQIQIRRADKIIEDGVEIAKTYHRQVLAPGEDLKGQDQRVATIAQAVWTPDVVTTYKEKLAQQILSIKRENK